MSFVSYAQNFEDVMLWRALTDVDKGFYIDIGAQDPIVDSVSMAFYERGWRGVSVEPNSHYAENLRKERPDEIIEQVAISDRLGSLEFFEFPKTGLSTADNDIAQKHIVAGFECVTKSVQTITLDDLLEKYKERQPVHWLKIDVEGFEKQVLEGWQLCEVRPWIIVAESTEPLSQVLAHKEWEHLIIQKGYKFVYFDGLNRFYLHETQNNRRPAFKLPVNIFDDFALSGKASQPFHRMITTELALKNRDLAEKNVELSSVHDALSIEKQRVLEAESRALTSENKMLEETYRANQAEALAQQYLAQARFEQAQLNAVQATFSWRITRPLRGVRRILKGDLGPIATMLGLPSTSRLNRKKFKTDNGLSKTCSEEESNRSTSSFRLSPIAQKYYQELLLAAAITIDGGSDAHSD